MENIHARADIAKMVKFKTAWNWTVRFLVIVTMRHKQRISNPHTGIPVRLLYWKQKATGFGILNKLNSFIPFRNIRFRPNSPHVLRVRDEVHMVWIDAASMPTEMVKFHSSGYRAVSLFPEPNMPQDALSVPINPCVSIRSRCSDKPASGKWIFDWMQALAMAWVVIQAMFPNGVISPGSFSQWRYEPAAAQAQAGFILNSFDSPFIMVFDVTDIAAFDQAATSRSPRLGSDGDRLSASTKTDAARVWPSGIIRRLLTRQPAIVALQKGSLAHSGQRTIASTTAKADNAVVKHSTPPWPAEVLSGSSRPFSIIGTNHLSFELSEDNLVLPWA